MNPELNHLKMENGLYKAGLPGFPRNFTRDSIVSAILMQNTQMLKEQIVFSANRQGKLKNSKTGEEPGKIFHEYPGVEINNLYTDYNACDTSALFLIGLEKYEKFTNDQSLGLALKTNIELAIKYILNHTQGKFFVESPEFCGASQFALKVTYWKDSALINRLDGNPNYPITYTLAQIQNICALRSAQFLLKTNQHDEKINQMLDGLHSLFDSKQKLFAIAQDNSGKIFMPNSDILHGLFYLQKSDLTQEEVVAIQEMAIKLETNIGYRTITADYCNLKEAYHSCSLWPFEQAVIHSGSTNFGLNEIAKISSRIKNYLDTAPELFLINDDIVIKNGCDPQLWTIAAKDYFSRVQK